MYKTFYTGMHRNSEGKKKNTLCAGMYIQSQSERKSHTSTNEFIFLSYPQGRPDVYIRLCTCSLVCFLYISLYKSTAAVLCDRVFVPSVYISRFLYNFCISTQVRLQCIRHLIYFILDIYPETMQLLSRKSRKNILLIYYLT